MSFERIWQETVSTPYSRRLALAVALLGVLGILSAVGLAPARAATPGLAEDWIEQSSANSPPARFWATMADDPGSGQVVLFGGDSESGFLDDTWTWDGQNWTQQHPEHSPPARQLATMAYDPGSGQVVLFGGYGEGEPLNDTWTWDGQNWTLQHPEHSPPAREGATMAYDSGSGQLVLFGGYGFLGDTWTWDGHDWTQQHPEHSPSARWLATMAYDPGSGHVVLFGGYGGSYEVLDDTWTWDGSEWTQQHPAHSPPARENAMMADDPGSGHVVLFGGYGASYEVLDDTWTWEGSEWTQQTPEDNPPGLWGAAMAYDPASGRAVLFGGYDERYELVDETWTYGPPDPPTATITSPADHGTYALDEAVPSSFHCEEGIGGPRIESCWDSEGVGGGSGTLDTSSAGPHTYAVTATSADGLSATASIEYTVNQAAQTISFSQPPDKAVGDPDFGVSASASSGLPVSFSSQTASVCTVAGATVNLLGAGTCTIAATQVGNADYEPAPQLTRSFAVARATSAVIFLASPSSDAAPRQPVRLLAGVSGASPSGSVVFKDGEQRIGEAPLAADGQAKLTTRSLTPGRHRIRAVYSGDPDTRGSASPPLTVRIAPLPNPRLRHSPNSSHHPGPRGDPRYTFVFSDHAAGVRFQCRLDKRKWQRCSSPKVYRRLRRGRHVFRLRSIDRAGNRSAVRMVRFFAGRRHR